MACKALRRLIWVLPPLPNACELPPRARPRPRPRPRPRLVYPVFRLNADTRDELRY